MGGGGGRPRHTTGEATRAFPVARHPPPNPSFSLVCNLRCVVHLQICRSDAASREKQFCLCTIDVTHCHAFSRIFRASFLSRSDPRRASPKFATRLSEFLPPFSASVSYVDYPLLRRSRRVYLYLVYCIPYVATHLHFQYR